MSHDYAPQMEYVASAIKQQPGQVFNDKLSQDKSYYKAFFNTKNKYNYSIEQFNTRCSELGLTALERAYTKYVFDIENVHSNNGWAVESQLPYVGLGQFARTTWQNVTGEDFINASVPGDAIMATVKLFHCHESEFHRLAPGIEVSKEMGYLFHNQGFGAGESYLQTNSLKYPKQSKVALAAFHKAREQIAIFKSTIPEPPQWLIDFI